MTLLCFLLDLRSLPPPLLFDLKQNLLQLANLYAVTRERGDKDEILTLRDRIGLCYVRNSGATSELKIAYRPGQSFSLSCFHHAVNNLPTDCFLPESSEVMPDENDNKEVPLTNLLSNKVLYTWGDDDIMKKVIAVSTTPFTNTETFGKSLKDAAEHCVTVEFIVLEQNVSLSNGAFAKLSRLVNSLHGLKNCVVHKYFPERQVLSGLVKRWLHELRSNIDKPLEAVFLFKNAIVGSINQICCNLSASSRQIIDGFTPCQACRCHAYPTRSSVDKTRGPFCPLTQRKLNASDLIETAVMAGEQTLLLLPSLDCYPKLQQISAPLKFNVIERTNLDTMNEGVILGTSYVVTPVCRDLDAVSDECDTPEINAQIFHGLCGALFQLDQGMVCSSYCNTETMMDGTFQCFYLLQPSDKGPMLLRRLAGAEEVLAYPDTGQLSGMVISQETRNYIQTSLSSIEIKEYNPLHHERGFHQKMNWLVKESLQLGSIPPGTDPDPELSSPPSIQVTEFVHPNQNKDDTSTTTPSVTEEWEQLLIVDDIDDDYSLASMPKPNLQNFTTTQSKPFDDKTSRILERLEAPKQLKKKETASPSASINGQMKRPLLPFASISTQLIKPHFQKFKKNG